MRACPASVLILLPLKQTAYETALFDHPVSEHEYVKRPFGTDHGSALFLRRAFVGICLADVVQAIRGKQRSYDHHRCRQNMSRVMLSWTLGCNVRSRPGSSSRLAA